MKRSRSASADLFHSLRRGADPPILRRHFRGNFSAFAGAKSIQFIERLAERLQQCFFRAGWRLRLLLISEHAWNAKGGIQVGCFRQPVRGCRFLKGFQICIEHSTIQDD